MKILIINGPNLNLLGKREPGIYGNTDFETYLAGLRAEYPEAQTDYFQSNIEGEIIDAIQQADGKHPAQRPRIPPHLGRHRRRHRGRGCARGRGAYFVHPRPRRFPPHIFDSPRLPRLDNGLRPRRLPPRPPLVRKKFLIMRIKGSEDKCCRGRHCEERSDEAIQKNGLDCFTLRVRNDEKSNP